MTDPKTKQTTPEEADKNRIHIKNMVCPRCVMAVKELLNQLDFPVISVELGKAIVGRTPDGWEMTQLRERLQVIGFELIDDKRLQVVEQIKDSIIELVHYRDNDLKVNLSDYLADKCHSDYSHLSKLFSEVCGVTIEKYFIAQKIERVKELLLYDELSLNEIALLMNYSSTAHLSSQFKQQRGPERRPLDKIL